MIPAYNAARTLGRLLDSIQQGEPCDAEVIVVDDASTDGTADVARTFGVKVIRLDENRGPAYARNVGIKAACGETVLFLDSDVVIPSHFIAHVVRRLEDDPAMIGMNGYYHYEALNPGFFPRYKARYVHFMFQGKEDTEVLETCCAAVRRDALLESGGFDTSYRGADVEDYELGYRIAQHGRMVIDHGMVVRHHFPGFAKNARNYFRRGALWTQLFLRRWKFDSAATTPGEGLGHVFGALSAVLVLLCVPLFVVSFLCYLAINAKFFGYLLKTEGALFTLAAVFTHWANSIVIVAGVAWGTFIYVIARRPPESKGDA